MVSQVWGEPGEGAVIFLPAEVDSEEEVTGVTLTCSVWTSSSSWRLWEMQAVSHTRTSGSEPLGANKLPGKFEGCLSLRAVLSSVRAPHQCPSQVRSVPPLLQPSLPLLPGSPPLHTSPPVAQCFALCPVLWRGGEFWGAAYEPEPL